MDFNSNFLECTERPDGCPVFKCMLCFPLTRKILALPDVDEHLNGKFHQS